MHREVHGRGWREGRVNVPWGGSSQLRIVGAIWGRAPGEKPFLMLCRRAEWSIAHGDVPQRAEESTTRAQSAVESSSPPEAEKRVAQETPVRGHARETGERLTPPRRGISPVPAIHIRVAPSAGAPSPPRALVARGAVASDSDDQGGQVTHEVDGVKDDEHETLLQEDTISSTTEKGGVSALVDDDAANDEAGRAGRALQQMPAVDRVPAAEGFAAFLRRQWSSSRSWCRRRRGRRSASGCNS